MFSGSIVALVTPFKNGGIDEKAFQSLVDWQVTEGTHGLVPCGTTGESPVLTHAEHQRVVELTIEAAGDRVPVIAGTGSNSTAEAIELTRHAKKAGADAALLVTPYYNKPSQEGMYQHFKAIHDAVDLPLVLYNIPGRSVVNLTTETLDRLSKLKNIVGIKDATGDIARVSATRLLLGPKFCQLSGEDATALGFNAHGGHGCISVTANVAPSLCARFQTACIKGDWNEALALQDRLMPLHTSLFLETSPAAVKYGVSLLGRGLDDVRLPLVACTEGVREKVRVAMMAAGVLN